MLFNHLVLIALAPLALAQLPDGSTCAVNGDCNSRLCNVPFAGPGDIQCLPRPAPNTASCDKSLEATDCERYVAISLNDAITELSTAASAMSVRFNVRMWRLDHLAMAISDAKTMVSDPASKLIELSLI